MTVLEDYYATTGVGGVVGLRRAVARWGLRGIIGVDERLSIQ
jgi:hypothetical protein